MKKRWLFSVLGALTVARAQLDTPQPPVVFQAAGPTPAAIRSTVDEFRTSLGDNNFNAAGPLDSGRREINWDGGGNNSTTAIAASPLRAFQLTRGAIFTTDGSGFVQAPAFADPAQFPPGGMVGVFDNPNYATDFAAFSALRLFSAIGSNVMEVTFVVPGGDNRPAAVTGFGAVFTDVDQPDGGGPGGKHGNRGASTLVEFFGARGELLFSSFVAASPGDASQSFLGVVFDGPRIASVRITSGDVAPGPDDGAVLDIPARTSGTFGSRVPRAPGRPVVDVVLTDDFIYGEPRPLP